MTDYETLFTDAFLAEVEDRKANTTYPPEEWTAGGRVSKAWPQKEDATWWLTTGPGMVGAWGQWWSQRKAEGWGVWTTPGGQAAIELNINALLGGTMFRGYIDAVLVDPDGDLVVVDWKSSAREPIAPIQIGAYAVAMEKTLNVRPRYGACYMVRKGDLGVLYDLSWYSEKNIGDWFRKAARMEAEGLYIPHPSSLCSACGVRDFCGVMGGKRADEVADF